MTPVAVRAEAAAEGCPVAWAPAGGRVPSGAVGAFTAGSVRRGTAGSATLGGGPVWTRALASPAEIALRDAGLAVPAPGAAMLGIGVAPVRRGPSGDGEPGGLFGLVSPCGEVMWMMFPHLHLMR